MQCREPVGVSVYDYDGIFTAYNSKQMCREAAITPTETAGVRGRSERHAERRAPANRAHITLRYLPTYANGPCIA
ncbi:jg9365 [Pararge aegeria aegeria]|uniref:Jg9365 protein n=1 Tax=Pararge aegeria aegeria TaxID=348720 RepID=A0A8S4RX78_9NEOP|nr:jg9365 [Pararge aegeria aegeria]